MFQMFRWLGWLLFGSTVFLGSVVVFPATAQKKKSLQRLYQDAKRLVVRKKYRRALHLFRAVLQQMKEKEEAETTTAKREHWRQQRASLLYVIGRTSEYASMWPDAYQAYKDCEKLGPSDAMRDAIRKRAKALLKHIRSYLVFNTNPENTWVELIDSQGRIHKGRSPLKLVLPPGTVSFSVSRKGYETMERRITLEPLQKTQFFLDLIPQKIRKAPPPSPRHSWRLPVAWTSVGLGIASAVAAVTLLVVSQQQLANYDARRNAANAAQRFQQDREAFVEPLRGAQGTEAGSIATFVGTIAFAGVAVGILLWAPPTIPATPPPASPSPAKPKQLLMLP